MPKTAPATPGLQPDPDDLLAGAHRAEPGLLIETGDDQLLVTPDHVDAAVGKDQNRLRRVVFRNRA